jgi:hypothetical protein
MLRTGEIGQRAFEKKWQSFPYPKGEYCIDGYANWGYGGNGSYLGDEAHQLVIFCPNDVHVIISS